MVVTGAASCEKRQCSETLRDREVAEQATEVPARPSESRVVIPRRRGPSPSKREKRQRSWTVLFSRGPTGVKRTLTYFVTMSSPKEGDRKAPEKKKRIYLPDELESPELESTSENARGANDPVRGEGDRSATENEQSKTDQLFLSV